MARTVSIKLLADVSGYVSGLKRGSDATKDFTGKLDQAAKAGRLDAVADQATRFGLVGATAFGLVVKSAADFDKQMSAVSAATHASRADMDRLRDAALQAGKDTAYSATQAAQGITELSKAGISTADVLNGGLKGALSLAAAGQIDVGEAAETAASAMTQFRLSGDKVPHIADLLAAASGKAQGSVHDMGFALAQSGLVASQFGLSIEDTTGTLAAFANAGLIGSDAGTSFKTMLLHLANPSEEVSKNMEALGLSAYDAQGNFIGITKLAGMLQKQLGGLTQEQRDSTLAMIFGTDAIRGANVLYQQGAKGIQGWIDKTNDAGYASDTAAKLTDNLAGDLERLKGSLETMAIEAGGGANGGLRILVKSLSALVDEFGNLPPVVGTGLTVLAGVGGASALALAAFLKLRSGLATAVEQLTAIGPAGEKAAGKLQAVASTAGKVAAVFAALEVVGAVADQFKATSANSDKLASSLTNLAQTGKSAGEITRVFGDNMEDFAVQAGLAAEASHGFVGGLNSMLSNIPGLGSAFDALNERLQGGSFNKAKDSMASLDGALVSFMNTTNDAGKSSELWNQLLLKSGMNTDEFAGLLPNAYRKLGELNTAAMQGAGAMSGNAEATGDAAAGAKKYASAAEAAAGAAKGEAGALVELSKQLRAQVDPVFALLDAEGGLTRAQKEAAKAVKEHGRNSDEAKEATRKLALAALDLQGKAGALSGTFDGKMTPALHNTLRAAGLTETQIKDVARQFRQAKADAEKYDGSYVARASTKGVPAVRAELNDLLVKQRALQQGLSIGSARSAIQKDLDRDRQRAYADGGWTGPGSKWEPAGIVHADEFVVSKSARGSLESQRPGALDYMNTTGRWPGYDGGGQVWPYPVTAARARIPSLAEVTSKVMPSFGAWPSSPSAQRGDSGVWRSIVALIKSTGPVSGSFGNAYRRGDPLWHGSGRAVDWMGFNQDALASFLAARRPLELIHRTARRDYAYTRGVNKGSFNNALMQAHRNHVHIAMADGGVIREPVYGVGASGNTYSFGEGYRPETVTPGAHGGGDVYVTVQAGYVVSEQDLENKIARTIDRLRLKGRA